MNNVRLPFEQDAASLESRIDARDRAGRARAADPRFNVALEASAGTGKTRVLVDRYVNLLRAGVDPSNILAITFTRKAATEMRERILDALRTAAARGEFQPARWRELRERAGDIDISTIDAFCLSLLREFPLEAGLDPGFTMADETEVPRFVDESLDRALRTCRNLAREDEHVALVFAQLGDSRARAGLAALLARRIVAPGLLARYLTKGSRELTVRLAAERAGRGLLDVFGSMDGEVDDGLYRFVASGPADPAFMLLVRQLERLTSSLRAGEPDPAGVQAAFAAAAEYFLTQDGQPRSRLVHRKALFISDAQWQTHRDLVVAHAPRVADARAAYRRDLNALVSRGVWRMFRIAEAEYRRTLDAHAVLDFSDLLLRTLGLLRQMEEFSQSRYRLESRYHHVLVDEFQDTSRAQWELVALLVQSWGEGAGLAHAAPLPPSIFIVGDRKQSIYRFRDADVSVLQDAARHIDALRPEGNVRHSISRSFRSIPALLAFVNDVCQDVDKAPDRPDAFRYDEVDCFPLEDGPPDRTGALGVVAADSPEACAESTAEEIARLLRSETTVRDVATGVPRQVRPGDVAIVFRTRESHREFEEALERRGIRAYVYKGLGFFDADEIRDVLALLAHLADPASNLRAAAWLRSGFVRLSDEALRRLGPDLADALASPASPAAMAVLDPGDAQALAIARRGHARWRPLVDRLPAAELLDLALSESAYAFELSGPRFRQARENLKKIRGLVRRAQNKGYATLARIVDHLDSLAVGDDSNASIDAMDAVNLMTVHAAKGLEFPVVFVVNVTRGTGSRRAPMRVTAGIGVDDVSVSVGSFQSQSDEDEAALEREETKRLLYVALTRARDRLYLGAVTKDGVLQPARGSLAEVLPRTLVEQLSGAASSGQPIRWTASSGRAHSFVVCGSACREAELPPSEPETLTETALGPDDDFRPLEVSLRAVEQPTPTASAEGSASSRLRGVLVHRLIQRFGFPSSPPDDEHIAPAGWQVEQLIRSDEKDELIGDEALIDDAMGAYRDLAAQPEVLRLYRTGQALHEVPFLLAIDGATLRGTIDCLICPIPLAIPLVDTDDDAARSVTVLEFKTGRARPEHQSQVAMYRLAAEALFPGAVVDARLVYLNTSDRVVGGFPAISRVGTGDGEKGSAGQKLESGL